MTLLRILALLCCGFVTTAWAAPQPVMLYTDHDYPPFLTRDGKGLNELLAQQMTRMSGGHYRFTLTLLPRKRIDQLLAAPNWQGVVAWVSPGWYGDQQQQRYAWSSPILQDADLLLSRRSLALEWHGPETLLGLRLGGILGHRYVDVDGLVADGQIFREDVPTLEANVRKLIAGRVDAIFVSRSSYAWLGQRFPSLGRDTHLSARSRSQYGRHLFTSGHDARLTEFVRSMPAQLSADPEWQLALAQFKLQVAE